MDYYLIAHIGHTGKFSEHVVWWNPDSRGYTICIDKAGTYTEQEARSICSRTSLCLAVIKEEAAKLARSTPYYRRGDGTLAKLYDGDKHHVVPNGKAEWAALIKARFDFGEIDKPTPIGAKARAIYLPDNVQEATRHD